MRLGLIAFISLVSLFRQIGAINLPSFQSQASQETVKPKWKIFKLDGLTFSAPVHSSVQKFPDIEKSRRSYFLIIKARIDKQTVRILVNLLSKQSIALQNLSPHQMYTLITKPLVHSKNLVSSDNISLQKKKLIGIATKEVGKVAEEPYVFWQVHVYSQKAYLHASWKRPQNTEQYYHEVMRILNSMQFISKH